MTTSERPPAQMNHPAIAGFPMELDLMSTQRELAKWTQRGDNVDSDLGLSLFAQSMQAFETQFFEELKTKNQSLKSSLSLPVAQYSSSTPPNLVMQHYELASLLTNLRLLEKMFTIASVSPLVLARAHEIKGSPETTSKPLATVQSVPENRHINHIINMINLDTTADSSKVAMNFSAAAMHVSYLCSRSWNGTMPDLPANAQDALSVAIEANSQGDKNKWFENVCRSSAMRPHISHLSMQLHLKKWNRAELIQAAVCMGNERDPVINQIEHQIWETLFCISRGQIGVMSALEDLAQKLRWTTGPDSRVRAVEHWFRIGHCSGVSGASSGSVQQVAPSLGLLDGITDSESYQDQESLSSVAAPASQASPMPVSTGAIAVHNESKGPAGLHQEEDEFADLPAPATTVESALRDGEQDAESDNKRDGESEKERDGGEQGQLDVGPDDMTLLPSDVPDGGRDAELDNEQDGESEKERDGGEQGQLDVGPDDMTLLPSEVPDGGRDGEANNERDGDSDKERGRGEQRQPDVRPDNMMNLPSDGDPVEGGGQPLGGFQMIVPSVLPGAPIDGSIPVDPKPLPKPPPKDKSLKPKPPIPPKKPTKPKNPKKPKKPKVPKPPKQLKKPRQPKPKPKPKPKPRDRSSPSPETSSSELSEKSLFDCLPRSYVEDLLRSNSVVEEDLEQTSTRTTAKTVYTLYGPKAETREFVPQSHFQEINDSLGAMIEGIESGYIEGLPLHLSTQPNSSPFRIYSAEEFDKLSTLIVQETLRTHHIVVTNVSDSQSLMFDETGLASLGFLDAPTPVEDQSVSSFVDGPQSRLTQGTLRQVLQASRNPDGKILRCAFNPMTNLGLSQPPFSTDLPAFMHTMWRKEAQGVEFPTSRIRWGSAATAGAVEWWHLECNGFGAYHDILDGWTYILIGQSYPTGTADDNEDLTSLPLFLPPVIPAQGLCGQKWRSHGIALGPGTRIIIRPNTPYASIALDNVLSHRGNFLSTSTMQETAVAIVHAFILKNVVHRTSPVELNLLLRQTLAFYHETLVQGKSTAQEAHISPHLPDLTKGEGVFDMLSLCNLVIFSNVLDGRSYIPWRASDRGVSDLANFNRNGIDSEERYRATFSRSMALNILHWFSRNFAAVRVDSSEEVDCLRDVAYRYLVVQGRALLKYKERAEQVHTESGVEGCTFVTLQRQVEAVMDIDPWIQSEWQAAAVSKLISLTWEDRHHFTFSKRPEELVPAEGESERRSRIRDYGVAGSTWLDKLFELGDKCNFDLTELRNASVQTGKKGGNMKEEEAGSEEEVQDDGDYQSTKCSSEDREQDDDDDEYQPIKCSSEDGEQSTGQEDASGLPLERSNSLVDEDPITAFTEEEEEEELAPRPPKRLRVHDGVESLEGEDDREDGRQILKRLRRS